MAEQRAVNPINADLRHYRLLYHLEEPRKFVKLMAQVCRRVVIIDTHVADTQPNGKFALSEITENEGWSGRWFVEFPEGLAEKDCHEAKWSSWNNQKSFWPMKRDLIQGLRHAGFPMVLVYPIFDPWRELTHRVTIVALTD
jgi:hypothetical protein